MGTILLGDDHVAASSLEKSGWREHASTFHLRLLNIHLHQLLSFKS